MFENWFYVGLFGVMLLGVCIVDVWCDVLEVGWLCFKQQFYWLLYFVCDFVDIGVYMCDYQCVMVTWQVEQLQCVCIQCYEVLLDDLECEICVLLVFCDFFFDVVCFDYYCVMCSVCMFSVFQVCQLLCCDIVCVVCYGILFDLLCWVFVDVG